jgi:hypothetical protein
MKKNNEISYNCLKWSREGFAGREDGEGYLTSGRCNAIQNCHNESPLYNEYILIISFFKKRSGEAI